MILNKDTAKKTAKLLLEIKAIKLQPENPFIWASGWNSPIYCDNRTTLSFPSIRDYICENMSKIIVENFGKPDCIAGVATGAIAIGALISKFLDVPFIYIRNEHKKHGRKNRIEGVLKPFSNVVVVEDLISTGKSSLSAVEAINSTDSNVIGMVSIFSYGFDVAIENFKNAGVKVISLSDYDHLLELALDDKYINGEQLHILSKWRANPSKWTKHSK